MHESTLRLLVRRYDRPIMNNIHRADYVQCMIACAIGEEWRLSWDIGWDWAAWTCEHVESRARLDIKQSAARQSWDGDIERPRRSPGYDIAPRTGYWAKNGDWVAEPGRLADLYVFAWHGVVDERADQRIESQWQFFVVAEQNLPAEKKRIGLPGLKKIARTCSISGLRRAVKESCPPPEALQINREKSIAAH